MVSNEIKSRIVRNTFMLYVRQIISLLINLYTVRIVLNVLGIEDYGIFTVVGGIVSMFGFISNTLASGSQRFLAFELGKGDHESVKQTFSLIFISYIIIAFIVLLLCESFGSWFLLNKMNIPLERMSAARWIFQFSIFSFVTKILSAPYISAIIAREKIGVYAKISLIDVVLRLIIVFLIMILPFDRLKSYSVCLFISSLFVTISYWIYCRNKISETNLIYYWNWTRLKCMLEYAWRNMLGSLANLARSQGVNILLNMFLIQLLMLQKEYLNKLKMQ